MPVNPTETLFNCLKLLFRPLVRFCLRRSIGIQEFIEAGKMTFIEVAIEELSRSNQKISASRLRAATGMHRRDIARIYKEGKPKEESVGLITKVLGQWQGNSRFLTKGRRPRALTLDGENCEFNKLVSSVSTDIHPAAVLFALERNGLVKRTANRVSLKISGYLSKNPEEGFQLMSRDFEHLIRAVEENVMQADKTPNLHVRTEFDNISVDDLPQIREWLIKQGSAFHVRVHSFISKYDLDINPKEEKAGGGRVVLTSFGRTDKGS